MPPNNARAGALVAQLIRERLSTRPDLLVAPYLNNLNSAVTVNNRIICCCNQEGVPGTSST